MRIDPQLIMDYLNQIIAIQEAEQLLQELKWKKPDYKKEKLIVALPSVTITSK